MSYNAIVHLLLLGWFQGFSRLFSAFLGFSRRFSNFMQARLPALNLRSMRIFTAAETSTNMRNVGIMSTPRQHTDAVSCNMSV